MPFGRFAHSERGLDWFAKVAKNEFNNYFLACDGFQKTGLNDVEEFYKNVKRKDRDSFGGYVRTLHNAKKEAVLTAYLHFCEKVSVESAKIFNDNLSLHLGNSKNSSSALQPIFHYFFRVNGVRYILAGTDKNKPFAVYMNPSTEWSKAYEFVGITAEPLKSGQPEVLLKFTFKDKNNRIDFDLDLKIEIRWSHGKFCGNPEGKIYKKWLYSELPWSEIIPIV